MRTISAALIFAVGLLLLFLLPARSDGSLLPFFDRRGSSSGGSAITERIPDPFRILEQIPFGLDFNDDLVPPVRVDWKETPDAHVMMLDVPGLKSGELKIEVDENRILRVSGERKKEEMKKDDHYHVVERAYGKFWRQFRLPENSDLDSVKAKLEDGVLTVTVKKLSPDQVKGPRVVSIEGTHEKAKLGDRGDAKVEL